MEAAWLGIFAMFRSLIASSPSMALFNVANRVNLLNSFHSSSTVSSYLITCALNSGKMMYSSIVPRSLTVSRWALNSNGMIRSIESR